MCSNVPEPLPIKESDSMSRFILGRLIPRSESWLEALVAYQPRGHNETGFVGFLLQLNQFSCVEQSEQCLGQDIVSTIVIGHLRHCPVFHGAFQVAQR